MKEADLAARAERAEALHPDEHVQYVETLLFLGHVLWETQAVDEAERVHGKALGVARERLGDRARARPRSRRKLRRPRSVASLATYCALRTEPLLSLCLRA